MGAQLAISDVNFLQMPARAEHGAADTVVLIHGLATNMAFWYAGVAGAFTHLANVLLFDLRGHGRSAMTDTGYTADVLAGDLELLLDHLRLQNAHIVGHSYGGLVALAFALSRPERTKSLVLADVRLPCVQRELPARAFPYARAIQSRLAKVGIEIDADNPDFGIELLTQMAKLSASGDPRAEAFEKIVMGARRLIGPRTAKRWLQLMASTQARAQFARGLTIELSDLRTFGRPAYGIYGAESMTLPSGRALEQTVPNFRLDVLARAGHFFPASRPKAFAFRVGRFLAREMNISASAFPQLLSDDASELEDAESA